MSEHIERKRTARRKLISDMGAKLFAEKGYHATRMQDIADALDLQKGTLYYYFPAKETLLFTILEEELESAHEQMLKIVTTSAPVLTKIELAVEAHLTIFHRYPDIYTIYLFEKLNTINQSAAFKVDEKGRAIELLWRTLLQEGIETGELKVDVDVGITTKAILGMCNMTLIWYDANGRLSIEEAAQKFTHLILNGLKA